MGAGGGIGLKQSTGQTFDYFVTRDKLIELAHKVIGVLEPGQVLDGEQLQDGIDLLSIIVRETDESGHKWRWTVQDAYHLPLVSNCVIYDVDSGLPSNIAELISVVYRDQFGNDSAPLDIMTAETYEGIGNKLSLDNPRGVYLTEDINLATRKLYVWPIVGSVATQSFVTGTDGNVYGCVYQHTASAINQPTSGQNYSMFWQPASGQSGSTWASGTAYTSPQLLRLLYRRPLYDFTAQDDAPDFPIQWPRLLLYKLAFDLGNVYGIPADERNEMIEVAKGSFKDIYPSIKNKSNTRHNKVKFF